MAIRWKSINGKHTQIVLSDKEVAEEELGKAARKLKRMITHKKLYRPLLKEVKYSAPSHTLSKNYWNKCKMCGRWCCGQRCRECWNKKQWQTYEEKRKADDERVALAKACFITVIKRKETEMKKQKQAVMTPIQRSTSGLRVALFEEMEALRSGSSSAQRARSVAMMANSILQSVQVEIEYHKYVSANRGKVEGEPKVVQLGTSIQLGEQAA